MRGAQYVPIVVKDKLNAPIAAFGHPQQAQAKLDRAGQAGDDSPRNLLVASDNVIALITENTEGLEARPLVNVHKEQPVQYVLVFYFRTVFNGVADIQSCFNDRPGADPFQIFA